jgi:hypothetical protein
MSIFRRLAAVGLAASVLSTSAGCSRLHELQSNLSQADRNISQWTADTMSKAFAAINAKIGADPADYLSVLVNELFVRVRAIDPHKRENVDQYTYQGGSVEVAPVDVSRSDPGAVEASLFKGDTVKAAVLAQEMASAPKDSMVENATIEWVMVDRTSFVMPGQPSAQPQIHVEAKGPRGDKIVHYDITGQLLNVSQG